jgi:hypothetical protein
MGDMAGSWQVIAATCHGVFGLFMRQTKHNGRYGSFFQKLQQRKVRRAEVNSRRIEITMGITCHTCHTFSIFGLGTPFGAIATCHQTCHGLAIAGKSA